MHCAMRSIPRCAEGEVDFARALPSLSWVGVTGNCQSIRRVEISPLTRCFSPHARRGERSRHPVDRKIEDVEVAQSTGRGALRVSVVQWAIENEGNVALGEAAVGAQRVIAES